MKTRKRNDDEYEQGSDKECHCPVLLRFVLGCGVRFQESSFSDKFVGRLLSQTEQLLFPTQVDAIRDGNGGTDHGFLHVIF